MTTQNLKNVIKEISEGLYFLSNDQIIQLIADMVEELLPYAILQIKDIWKQSDYEQLKKGEFLERRKWWKRREDIENLIAQRRETLDQVKNAKSELVTIQNSSSSLLSVVPLKRNTRYNTIVNSSLNDVENGYRSRYGNIYSQSNMVIFIHSPIWKEHPDTQVLEEAIYNI